MGSQLPLKAPPVFGSCLCGQTAGWMKMPLGIEVDLGPGHIVLDGVPAPHERGTAAPPPLSGPCLLWPWSPISATAVLFFIPSCIAEGTIAAFVPAIQCQYLGFGNFREMGEVVGRQKWRQRPLTLKTLQQNISKRGVALTELML